MTTYTGAVDTLPIAEQIEAIYIGYFGRPADAGGLAFWEQYYVANLAQTGNVDVTLTNIANYFSTQAETIGLYPELAGSVTSLPLTGPGSITALVDQIYINLFGAVNAGASFWINLIHNGTVTLGSAIFQIANGATSGVDNTVLLDRIQVANEFSAATATAGIALNGNVTTAFITEGRDLVLSIGANGSNSTADLTDQLAEANAAITAFVANGGTTVVGPGVTFTLTLGQDTFTGFGDDTFNAPLEVGTILGTTAQFQTLTVGDSLTEISAGGTLNATFLPLGLIPDLVTGLTIAGLSTWNLSDFGILPLQTVALTGSDITAPTTLSYTNSLGNMQIGTAPQPVLLSPVLGVGLLSTINVTADADVAAPLNGYQYLAISMKASDFSGSDSITVNANGVGFGAPTHGGLPGGSSVLGVIAGPTSGTVGYLDWTVNSMGGVNNNIALGAETATNAAQLTITDDGNPATTTWLGTSFTDGSSAANWANLTTIDASGTSEQLTVTGGEFGCLWSTRYEHLGPCHRHWRQRSGRVRPDVLCLDQGGTRRRQHQRRRQHRRHQQPRRCQRERGLCDVLRSGSRHCCGTQQR